MVDYQLVRTATEYIVCGGLRSRTATLILALMEGVGTIFGAAG